MRISLSGLKAAAAALCATIAITVTAQDFVAEGLAYSINDDAKSVTLISAPDALGASYNGLTAATIPEQATPDGDTYYTVTAIAPRAFYGCTTLEGIYIPATVEQVGDRALAYCPALASIEVDAANPHYDSRGGCNALISTADNTLVAGCRATLLDATVTAIGPFAFLGCSTLTAIELPQSLTAIGYEAFGGCTALQALEIPASATDLGYRLVAGCDALATLTVADGNRRYHSPAGSNAVVETATATLAAGCAATAIPAEVTRVGYEAMSGCGAIERLTLPETVTELRHYAFRATASLTRADLPATLATYGDRAFGDCTGLRHIFSYNTTPEAATYFALSTFAGVDTTTCIAHVPEGTVDTYRATMPWTPFVRIVEIDDSLPGDVNGDGVVDVTDVNILINIILGGDDAANYDRRAYILGNDTIDISDVNALINLVLENA